jgi:hypothetical protein
VPDQKEQSESADGARFALPKRRLWLLAAPLLVLVCLPAINSVGRRAAASAGAPGALPGGAPAAARDYSRFSHSSPREHAELTGRSNCASCHRRGDGSPEPRFPAHRDCTGCHLAQFTEAGGPSPVNPICTVCHGGGGPGAPNPSTKKFPGLLSFTAEFDHAQHVRGGESARPADGCVTCHAPTRRGVAKTIPARLDAHQTCYQCHSPGRQAGNLSSCGSCHGLGTYSPTPTGARAYRRGFSHADHGAGRRLSCDSCHAVKGRGLPQARQVSSALPVQHFADPRAQSCKTCHNGRRAFGDEDFNFCNRCHRRPGYRMGE